MVSMEVFIEAQITNTVGDEGWRWDFSYLYGPKHSALSNLDPRHLTRTVYFLCQNSFIFSLIVSKL